MILAYLLLLVLVLVLVLEWKAVPIEDENEDDKLGARSSAWAAFAVTLIVAISTTRSPAQTTNSPILQEIRQFRQMGTVLYVAAHPDDENTQLITYLARGRNYRTAYLSLTRGDGGQNVLGPEFGDELGVIRTQELLAARRLDGGRQFFTRAIDFGFSKNPTETLKIWDRQQVLSDIVRIIREFRPDVVITRFSPEGGGHGHHTASAILALEAFKLAGSAKAFPEQLRTLTPWQPKRILQNSGGFGRGGNDSDSALRIEIGGDDPVTGTPFGELAGGSRSMHKTQGFGNFGGGGRGARSETFQLLAGEPSTKDILDGVDTTWGRVEGGKGIDSDIEALINNFKPEDPSASIPALLRLRTRVASLAKDPVVQEKDAQLDRIIQHCLQLDVSTSTEQKDLVPGETLKLHHKVALSSPTPLKWLEVRYPAVSRAVTNQVELLPGKPAALDASQTIPTDTPLTEPYWLREDHAPGLFRVSNPALIGRPENPPVFPVEFVFELAGERFVISDEPVTALDSSDKRAMHMEIVPPVWLHFPAEVRLLAPGASKSLELEATASRPGVAGTINLDAPERWNVEPASQQFTLAAAGDKKKLTFKVTAPADASTANISAHAEVNGQRFGNDSIRIQYPHIPPQLLQPHARVKTVALEMATRGHQVGYVPGAGDSVAEALEEMGYEVTKLQGPDLTPENLRKFDAVVVGVRAFNVRNDLAAQMPALFEYVENGGTLIEQYNRPDSLKVDKLAPYDLRLSGERITDENAPVTFLAPEHAALNTPNKITQADFGGWVQERGIYFPNRWDEHFTPILACNDPGESPLKGSLLIARHGKGYFVYTGLVWFRQLPAGVPGAYRLFANLVSLGK